MKTPYYNVPNLQKIADLEAEIARLKAERETDCEIMRKTVSSLTKACKDKDRLITKLADELDRFHRYSENMDLDILIDYSLVKQAREATKDE